METGTPPSPVAFPFITSHDNQPPYGGAGSIGEQPMLHTFPISEPPPTSHQSPQTFIAGIDARRCFYGRRRRLSCATPLPASFPALSTQPLPAHSPAQPIALQPPESLDPPLGAPEPLPPRAPPSEPSSTAEPTSSSFSSMTELAA
ncbi:hypothetical protein BDN72DRAFT_902836 [Pluteus cervinus]|uniref:Uncharacterized protein n=1 Tax=Pluteus cervinus TaxID=181527 RepID=A0ACD3AAM4_9AGAR|nr:hypothetical protein BDN72DRAFT_902836 [Pluteus cervinus]